MGRWFFKLTVDETVQHRLGQADSPIPIVVTVSIEPFQLPGLFFVLEIGHLFLFLCTKCEDSLREVIILFFQSHRIAPDVYMLKCVETRWPSGCNVYLIRDNEGWALFDTSIGTPEGIDALFLALQELNISPENIQKVFLTHAHTDHIGGALPLLEVSQGKLYIPEKDVPEATDFKASMELIMPEDVQSLYPELEAFDILEHFRSTVVRMLKPEECTNIVQDGDVLNVGRFQWKVIHTPGHDPGHVVYYEANLGLIIGGDLFAQKGTITPWYSPGAGGVEAYLDSLAKIEMLPARKILPGHGNILENPQQLIQETRKIIYDREKIILKTLAEGAKNLRFINRLIYSKKVWDVVPWCSTVTYCHLNKLLKEGKITFHEQTFLWTSILQQME